MTAKFFIPKPQPTSEGGTDPRQTPEMHTPTVPELLDWFAAKSYVWYLAPLNLNPCRVYLRSKIRTWKKNPSRFAVSVEGPSIRFRIDEGHLDRLRVPDNWRPKAMAERILGRTPAPAPDPTWANPATGGLNVKIDFGSKPQQHLHWLLNVDLKHSLWSKDRAYWEEYAPGAWDRMEACFTGQTAGPSQGGTQAQQLIVQTAPKKEIRYGQVIFNPGLAQVHFWAEWDEDEQDEPPNLTDTIQAATFQECMDQIDQIEQSIIDLGG